MGQLTKLHLGCGEQYLEGYVNIDFPQSEHSVIKTKADKFADIRELDYPAGSVDEIRSHHVFEHFTRPETLKLLKQWHGWLKIGGKLVIDTPDFEKSAKKFLGADFKTKEKLIRHIFGSQEARWANHLDGWYGAKFRFILTRFGFEQIKIERFSNRLAQKMQGRRFAWRPLLNLLGDLMPQSFYDKHGGHKMPNVVATAIKGPQTVDFKEVATEMLSLGLVGKEGSEMLSVWMKDAGL